MFDFGIPPFVCIATILCTALFYSVCFIKEKQKLTLEMKWLQLGLLLRYYEMSDMDFDTHSSMEV